MTTELLPRLKAERRAQRKKNRNFPMHGRASIQLITAIRHKEAMLANNQHTFSGCWCGHEKGHRWNGSILKCDPCIRKAANDKAIMARGGQR